MTTTKPIHYACTQSRGLVIYAGRDVIAQTSDPYEAQTLAGLLLLWQRQINGVQLSHRDRLGIAAEALKLAGDTS